MIGVLIIMLKVYQVIILLVVGMDILILCVIFGSMFIMLNFVMLSLKVFSVSEKIVFFIYFIGVLRVGWYYLLFCFDILVKNV